MMDLAKIKAGLDRARPGKVVELIDGNPETAMMVFPVRFSHVRKYMKAIENAIKKLASENVTLVDGRLTAAGKGQIYGTLVRIVIEDFIDLVDETCNPTLTMLNPPHDLLPKIVGAWVEENFMGDRLDPWKQELKKMFSRLTRDQQGTTSGIISQFLAPAASPSKTSSSEDSMTSPTTDGATLNSGTSLA